MDPQQRRRYADKAKFRLTAEQSDEIRSRGKCDVCGETGGPKELAIDHDHSCCPTQKTCGKCIRGLLCYHCNLILGHSKDSPELLKALADYLERSAK